MRKKIYSILALLCLTGTSAWADDYLYLEVDGTSATVKYGDKGSNPYYGDDPRDPDTYGWYVAEDEYMPDQVTDYNGKKSLTTVTIDASCQNYTGTTLENFFDFWSGLTTINNLENLNTSEVTNMKRMFTACSSMTSFDLSGLNTAKVTNMSYMFNSVSVETLDLSGWNTSSVTNMYCMFYNCSKLETIYVGDGWSTASVTNGDLMFGKCTSLPGFDSGNVTHAMAKLTTDGGYLTYKAPEPEPSTYTVTLKEGTEDATSWTIAPDEATTTGVAAGTEVKATYSGMKKVKSVKAKKAAAANPNAYLKWDATKKELVEAEIPAEVTTVANADAGVEWAAGTYVVEGDVTINGNITLGGNVDLIIKDGAKLTVNGRIHGSSSKYNLSIYGQANQSGQLVVNNPSGDAIASITTLEVHSCQVTATSPGNNRGGFYGIVTFNVYGGSVDAENTAATSGYGIYMSMNGSLNIYGGDVKAVGKGDNSTYSYGITGSSSITVTVYGGKLWAEGASKSALKPAITLTKGAGFTGKIETSDDGSSWNEYTEATTPSTKYVRVGY